MAEKDFVEFGFGFAFGTDQASGVAEFIRRIEKAQEDKRRKMEDVALVLFVGPPEVV